MKKKVAIITNMPTPYRQPVYNIVSRHFELDLIYSTRRESNRSWEVAAGSYKEIFLSENMKKVKGDDVNFRHNNPDVIPNLIRENPDVIVLCGFNLTSLYAFLYAKLYRKKIVVMTDGTIYTEQNISSIHKFVRRLVFISSHASISASNSGVELFNKYSRSLNSVFRVPLSVENSIFRLGRVEYSSRKYDYCSVGLVDRKNPLFVIEMAKKMPSHYSGVIIGSGELEPIVKKEIAMHNLNIELVGPLDQKGIAEVLGNTRVFLFPTKLDAWGVVTNEALASGCNVICSPYCGASDDLIREGATGSVLDLDPALWTNRMISIIEGSSGQNLAIVDEILDNEYSHHVSAKKFISAIHSLF